jgi:hypothetical protein
VDEPPPSLYINDELDLLDIIDAQAAYIVELEQELTIVPKGKHEVVLYPEDES